MAESISKSLELGLEQLSKSHRLEMVIQAFVSLLGHFP